MFFRGRSLRNPDLKGRLMLPSEFRDIIQGSNTDGTLVLTTYDNCVVGFPMPEWEEFEAKITSIKNPARNVRDFRRLVLGGAEVLVFDGQGRIRLSKEQMQYAGIEKEAIIVGLGPRFEIWAPDRLEPVITQNFDDVAESISEAGIDFGF